MLMTWCSECGGSGGGHEDVVKPVYGENVVAWVDCPVCGGSGLERDTDDCAFERLQARQKNVVGE